MHSDLLLTSNCHILHTLSCLVFPFLLHRTPPGPFSLSLSLNPPANCAQPWSRSVVVAPVLSGEKAWPPALSGGAAVLIAWLLSSCRAVSGLHLKACSRAPQPSPPLLLLAPRSTQRGAKGLGPQRPEDTSVGKPSFCCPTPRNSESQSWI